jgi:hypothetical protein
MILPRLSRKEAASLLLCGRPGGLAASKKMQWSILKVSNFEQTIAGPVCCFAQHRGIALSGHREATPTGSIGPGGVVPMCVSFFYKVSRIELHRDGQLLQHDHIRPITASIGD